MATLTDDTLTSTHDGFKLYAARAKAVGKRRGGVVVVQEAFGVTDHIRDISSFYADNGYDVIAPSMYDRYERRFQADMSPEGMQKVRAAMGGTPMAQGAADIQAAIDALGAGPVYITGFCYGGTMSWVAAQRCTGLAAASGFYGSMIVQNLDQQPKVPIILHFGAKDAHIPESDIQKIRTFAPKVPIYMYEADHGFCRKNSTYYDETASKLALQRTLDFFAASA